ncbi:antibiotic biosynthesis monooxygenase family protein [Thermoflavimicrobium dichotomicum]|uniref:Heme-degrading monooxygenase HmoA n=1 Tax=Thermoflavimicrobium dichotomicum TaxID=46223 RepID=A0A1I3JRI6_9BACL|nr:antibiotic biosynthesis monooxygenase [Thermoflavimicrobium dichotomicum]SFI62776.1 Heme-degrading monooxygenase HmoA [Thermoflavimicrobium dichotomicum]
MSSFASTPKPPYYAVIFTSKKPETHSEYDQMSNQLLELVKDQPGFLGVESARSANGLGITVSYWESLDAIKQWKQHTFHQIAQQKGKEKWYQGYQVRVAKVEKDYNSNF